MADPDSRMLLSGMLAPADLSSSRGKLLARPGVPEEPNILFRSPPEPEELRRLSPASLEGW
ncbi:MAG: hypothetical protein INR71_12745 [Terriglobus roseus]|nr:hypothetical protein [Terriglobus roseus]